MSQQESQPYDRALKSLLGDEAPEILPYLLQSVKLIGEENVEIDRSTLRADLVYNVLYKGKLHILSLELQTTSDDDMPKRLLTYHVGLLTKHGLPVISIVLYPFKTKLPEPPFIERSGDDEILRFHYKVFPVWEQDAQQIIKERIFSLYALLPAMKNISVPLLLQAIGEMEQHYVRDDLIDHIARFRVILNRTTLLTEQEKRMVEDDLTAYNSLFDNDPEIKAKVAKGEARGETKGAQKIVTEIVSVRFPTLEETARQRVATIQNIDMLSQLAKQIATADNEQIALWVLNSYAA